MNESRYSEQLELRLWEPAVGTVTATVYACDDCGALVRDVAAHDRRCEAEPPPQPDPPKPLSRYPDGWENSADRYPDQQP